MKNRLFQFRTKASEDVRKLLYETTIGSNGAKYQLLDTKNKIDELDSPLFLSLQRSSKVLGNITFCRRNEDWYIRYFAFSPDTQGKGKSKSKSRNNLLKNELKFFFEHCLKDGYEGKQIRSFYAYIEPNNVKSLWMSEEFGFQKIGEKVSQTFSRYSPKKKLNIQHSSDWNNVPQSIKHHFKSMNYFFEYLFFKGEYTYVTNDEGEFIAFCKTSVANWRIDRLPGKWGGLLVKVLPYIPFINRMIRPESHRFIVPEAVWVKDNDAKLLASFFESILSEEKLNLMIWWVDVSDSLYENVRKKVRWGIVNRMVGNSPVHVVAKANNFTFISQQEPIYSAGMDSF